MNISEPKRITFSLSKFKQDMLLEIEMAKKKNSALQITFCGNNFLISFLIVSLVVLQEVQGHSSVKETHAQN